MKVFWIQAKNLPEETNREFIFDQFKQFGKITKVYIRPDKLFANVYFLNKESAEEALCLDKKPPYCLSIKLNCSTQKSTNNFEKNNISNSDTNSVTSASTMDYEDIYGDSGPDLFNIHGIRVPTLTADDGKLYVEVGEVQNLGFALFPEQEIPNINYNKQMIAEFEMYMQVKARNYIRKMKLDMPERIVKDVRDKIISKYVNHRPPATSTPTFSSRPNQFNNTSYENGNLETSPKNISFRDQFNTENEHQKPLRKPINDNRPSQSTSNTRGAYNSSKGAHYKPREPYNESRETFNEAKGTNSEFRGGRNDFRGPRNETRSSTQTRSKSNTRKNNNMERIEKENTVPSLKEILTSVNRMLLTLNRPVKVVVSFVISPTKCWAYPEYKNDDLQKLMYDTNNEARKKIVCQPIVGQIYAAAYCGTWNRAIVVETTPSIKVHFIDYGNFNDEEVKEVLELPETLTTQPAFAVRLNFVQQPSTQLEDSAELNIMVLEKNSDNSYRVEEIIEKKESPMPSMNPNVVEKRESPKPSMNPNIVEKRESPKPSMNPNVVEKRESPKPSMSPNVVEKRQTLQPLMSLNIVPAGQIIKSATSQSNKKSKSIKSPIELKNNDTSKPSTSKTPQQLSFKEKLANMASKEKVIDKASLNPERKSVVDVMGKDTGILQFVRKYGPDKCLCAVMPSNFVDDLSALDDLYVKPDSQYVGKVGDSVCVEKDDGTGYARGTIIDVKPNEYTVALVDYGEVLITKDVAKLENKYMNIPEFTAVCTANPECIDLIEQGKDETTFIGEDNNRITVEFNSIFYQVTSIRWNPFETEKISEAPKHEAPVFTTRPVTKELKSGEQVKLMELSDDKLLVRNRETNNIFQKVSNEISEYNATPLTQKLIPNQIILCPHETKDRLCRGVIQSLNNHSAEVEYIDHGFVDTVPLKDIKSISESLAKEACSLIPIALKDFENGQYTHEQIEALGEYLNKPKRLKAEKCSRNIFDLKTMDKNESLTDILKNIGDKRLTYQDMKKRELNTGGIENLLCVNIDNIQSMVFIRNDSTAEEFADLTAQILDYVEEDKQPYSPALDELCLACYDDEWYRAAVKKENKAVEEYEVYYIDYGNSTTVTSSSIRKMPEKFAKFPASALHCCLTEILNNTNGINEEILSLVKNNITIGNSYDLKILKKTGSLYEVQLASLSKQLLDKLDF